MSGFQLAVAAETEFSAKSNKQPCVSRPGPRVRQWRTADNFLFGCFARVDFVASKQQLPRSEKAKNSLDLIGVTVLVYISGR